MSEIKQTIEELGKNFEAFKKKNDELIEQKAKGIVDSLLAEHVEKLSQALSDSEAAKKSAEQAELMAKRRFEVENQVESLTHEQRTQKEAFTAYLKGKSLSPEETQAMSSYSDPDGGYTILPELDREITRVLHETSPMRRIARVKSIGTDQYEKLQRINRVGARWKDRETAGGETSTPKYEKLTIRTHELEAEPKIPVNLINDSYLDVEAEVREAVAEEFSLTENKAFVQGDGIGQPQGFLQYPAGTSWLQIEQINSGAATAIIPDAIINMITALKSGYRSGAVFVANRRSIGELRKLKDGVGNYLWQPSFQAGEPAKLAGYSIIEFEDMPDIATNSLPLAFGDFKKAYTILDRMGTRVLVNPYKQNGYLYYYTTKRMGGGVDNFEALKILKVAV